MAVSILYHGSCFDGVASAALFAKLYDRVPGDSLRGDRVEPQFVALAHGSGGEIPASAFGPGDNTIVDFKYSRSEKLTWWFDHHQSAFGNPENEAHFKAYHGTQKFYDPAYSSCAKLIADVGEREFGIDWSAERELIDWADTIDAARYARVEDAMALEPPAQRLRIVIEGTNESAVTATILAAIATRPLAEVLAIPAVARAYAELEQGHERHQEVFARATRMDGRVAYYDVSGEEVQGHNKFLAYSNCPQAVYAVGISTTPERVKISAGYSPWASEPRRFNIASMCERHGGGGHPVVGAISFPVAELETARQVARDLVATLNGEPAAPGAV